MVILETTCATVVFLVGLGLVILLRVLLLVVRVRGQSMRPAFLDGEDVLVVRHWPPHTIRRGQVIFIQQTDASHGQYTNLIKRVVGLPGDVVRVTGTQSAHVCNPSADGQPSMPAAQVWHVPPGHVFVRGDNGWDSVDSVVFGPIPYNRIKGLVLRTLTHG